MHLLYATAVLCSSMRLLSSMRLARAGGTLAASGDALLAVRSTQERSYALARVNQAQQAINETLAELMLTIGHANTAQITQLSIELNHNLGNLSVMVDGLLELIEAQRANAGSCSPCCKPCNKRQLQERPDKLTGELVDHELSAIYSASA
jgi:hypothetical protein